MDNGLLIGLALLIVFGIMLIVSINNDLKEREKKAFLESLNEIDEADKTNTLLMELIKTEKSTNRKVNIIMCIMLIPIIISIIMLYLLLVTYGGIVSELRTLF